MHIDISDLTLIPDLSEYETIFHFTPMNIINDPNYYDKFSKNKTNICFPLSNRITYAEADQYYKSIKPNFMSDFVISNPDKVIPKNFTGMHQECSIKVYPS